LGEFFRIGVQDYVEGLDSKILGLNDLLQPVIALAARVVTRVID
jgi:hypothetical protein